MAVYIKKIELNNWFGYNGAYEENIFEFSNGVNIIVAANDVGKSKLHNAFRWMISDQVILKNNENKYELLTPNLNTIEQILNHETRALLNQDSVATMGVRLTFEETDLRGNILNRIITKEILCKKDLNRITISVPRYIVQKLEHGNIRTAPETFEELIIKVIRPNLKDFFLVQGESLDHLTPLKGDKLRTTINNLVSLNELDKKSDISMKLATAVVTLRQGIERSENQNNNVAAQNILKKTTLENEIKEIKEIDLPQIESFIEDNKKSIEQYRGQAEIAKTNKDLVKKLDTFNSEINQLQGAIDFGFKNLVENYINKEFWLSKITNQNEDKVRLKTFKEDLRDFSAKRRTELSDKLSEKEQNMLYALERDQPRPEILKQMLDENTCYVCSNELSKESKYYMKEKLIPFFRNELNNNDTELNKYVELNDVYLKLDGYLSKYEAYDSEFFNSKIADIVSKEIDKRNFEYKKEDFISENGAVSVDDNEKVSLATYDRAILDLNANEKKMQLFEKTLETKSYDLRKIQETIRQSGKTNESSKLVKVRHLEVFSNEIKDVLLEIKRKTYDDFAKDLEKISNEKFKAFATDNDRFTNQKIKVDFNLNHLNQPDFEIKVIDQFGNNLRDGGGASQALRQLAVIFGLVEKAGGNVNFPFIADAPTSNMSHTLSEHFFNYQLDHSTTQNILITKELWDDKIKSLNSMGDRILEKINNIENAKMISIVSNNKNNKRANIINLNNQY